MIDDLDTDFKRKLSQDVAISRREIAEGKGIPNAVVGKNMRKMLMRMKVEDEARARHSVPEP